MLKKTVANGENKVNLPVKRGISQALVDEVTKALKSVQGWGSIEIYVQNHNVTQITVRNIRKTRHVLLE